MKTQQFRLKRSSIMASLAVYLLVILSGINGCKDNGEDPSPLSSEDYFNKMKQILSYATTTGPSEMQPATANEIIQMGLTFYQQTLDSVDILIPPNEFLQQHTNYKQALNNNIDAFRAALAQMPDNAPSEDYYKYLYQSPDAGYAFGEETDAQCDLATAATTIGITDFPSRQACYESPQQGKSIGTAEAPVNDITILHDSTCNGTCPNLQYEITSIIAKTGLPITITFNNQNPLPFLFNLAVYKGNAQKLTSSQVINVTQAGGPKVHQLTLNLEPGTYTYADNVHPYSIRGTLTVIP